MGEDEQTRDADADGFEPASVHLEVELVPRGGTTFAKAARSLAGIAAGLLTNDLESGPSAQELVVRRRSTGNEIIRVVAGNLREADALLQHVRRDLRTKSVADFLAEWRVTHPERPGD